jgi:DNA-binding transcriptional LysR family regulator
MALELQQLRQVIALAEHGSFVRAAAALHISQPALSRSIQNLERRFGSELFVRSSSGAAPTDLGRLYIERARDVLRMADELDHEAVTHGTMGAGRIAVGGGPFPSESVLGPAAVRFIEQFPRMSVQLHARDWDELLRELRSRELDFFVAETSTLQREPDLDITPMPSAHSVYLVARTGHPLASRSHVEVADALPWPFVTPSRIPPRVLDPMLAAHRAATQQRGVQRPFPAIQCNGLAPVKRILATSDAVTGSILSCIATELESGQFVLLGTEPWLHLHYGIVSLKNRPWTQAAEKFREFVLEAEGAAALEEQRLVAKFGPRRARRGLRSARASDAVPAGIRGMPAGSGPD